LADMSEKIGHRDALYLFACHLEWRTERNLAAYQELLAALDGSTIMTTTFAALQNISAPKLAKAGAHCDKYRILVSSGRYQSKKRQALPRGPLPACGQ